MWCLISEDERFFTLKCHFLDLSRNSLWLFASIVDSGSKTIFLMVICSILKGSETSSVAKTAHTDLKLQ